jgi:sugar phosphate isomerase/epimerase
MRKFWVSAAVAFIVVGGSVVEAFGADVGVSKDFKGPTGLQLYSLRDMSKKQGPLAVLDLAKQWGIKYVEVADMGKLSPTDYKKELDKRGLIPVGMHCGYDQFKKDIPGIIAKAKALGLSSVGCPWIPHQKTFTEKDCLAAAEVFNKAGEELAKNGIKFYYHNHGYEFAPHGDGTLFDLLAAKTDPRFVYFQMDVMWTVHPGQDPVKLLKKYSGRWLLMHLKDLKKGVPTGPKAGGIALTDDVALGSGQMDWPAILKASQAVGVKYYLIEDESPNVVKQVPETLRYLEQVSF